MRPTYGYWRDEPGYTEERLVENMGLMENTAIIFTSDHGFYFGEHGGLFGKMTLAR